MDDKKEKESSVMTPSLNEVYECIGCETGADCDSSHQMDNGEYYPGCYCCDHENKSEPVTVESTIQTEEIGSSVR